MGENNPLAATKSPTGSSSKVIATMATEWTDEMHRLYLNSIEASFVKKLYNCEYNSNDLLGWSSRNQIPENSSESDPRNQSVDQFKVLRKGCWEKLKFERAKNQTDNENGSYKLSENRWIQHFKSHSTAKEPHLMLEYHMNGNNLVGGSVQLSNRRHGREATSLRQSPSLPSYSHNVRKFSVGSITEVSDQNFVDMEVERGEELSRRWSKKRARSTVSPITDQVVPFVLPTSVEKTAFLKENNEDCSKRNLEDAGDSSQMEPHSLLLNDQQPSDPKLRVGDSSSE